jgi:hypothetical protein
MARPRRSQPPRSTAASLEQADLRGQCQVLIFQLHAGGRAPGHRLSPSKRAIIATGLPHEMRWVRTSASCGSIARRPYRDGRRRARCARRGARGQGAGRSAPRRRLQHLLPPRPDGLGPTRPRRDCGRLDQLRPGEDAAAVVGGPSYRAAHRGRHPRARGAGGEGAVQRVLPGMGDRAPPGPGAGDENTGHYEHARRCPRWRARRRDPPWPTCPRAAGSEGANVVIVGHGNLMRAATGAYASEAGSGVYAPRASSEPGFELVARLAPDDWMRLAQLVGEDG